jgi:hypothetical protein
VILAAVLLWVTQPGASQTAPLTIVSAAPQGELVTIAEAHQIRVTFSAPMVTLGTSPASAPPSWIHIAPAAEGNWFWSATRTLMFSPDVSTPPGGDDIRPMSRHGEHRAARIRLRPACGTICGSACACSGKTRHLRSRPR